MKKKMSRKKTMRRSSFFHLVVHIFGWGFSFGQPTDRPIWLAID